MSTPPASTSEPSTSKLNFSLENVLGDNHDDIDLEPQVAPVGWDEADDSEKPVAEGYCVECEDQPAQLACEQCSDIYCDVCFAAQHRKGSRKQHKTSALAVPAREEQKTKTPALTGVDEEAMEEDTDSDDEELERVVIGGAAPLLGAQPVIGDTVGDWFLERAKYIPVRLSIHERKLLRLLEAALSVSEYTDKIDTIGFGLGKAKRIVAQIRELCAILSGLVLAADYKQGQTLFADKDFAKNEDWYQHVFEIGRRHKQMNPEKMRTTYVKLMYLLQDSQTPEVKDMLGFTCVKPMLTVYDVLESNGALSLLREDLISVATKEIYSANRTRREIQKDIKAKERGIETLASRYQKKGLDQETIRQCLYSIGDNHAFLRVNRDPCEKMIVYLKENFHATKAADPKSSLAIRSGKGGARLSHDHSKQYGYVIQSLTLWREILHDMFHLWSFSEQDLLSENVGYRLRDTGQGLNRVQGAPKTSRLMHAILHKAQQSVGTWIGSSVIHMGDHNVPNALMFLDKYTQIYRILLPIVNTLSQIESLAEKPAIRSYIEDEFGSTENLTKEILADFFRHAFDGSGADNFFDAGSCIDGRLTSAWNWSSSIEKKRYWPIFLLTGFTGFDGDW